MAPHPTPPHPDTRTHCAALAAQLETLRGMTARARWELEARLYDRRLLQVVWLLVLVLTVCCCWLSYPPTPLPTLAPVGGWVDVRFALPQVLVCGADLAMPAYPYTAFARCCCRLCPVRVLLLLPWLLPLAMPAPLSPPSPPFLPEQERLAYLQRVREQGDVAEMVFAVQSDLLRNLGNMTNRWVGRRVDTQLRRRRRGRLPN